MMEWKDSGRLATDVDIREFEQLHAVHLSEEHKDFLKHVVNGGMPVEQKCIHAVNCPGGACDLHGVYGVNPFHDYYNLGKALENYQFALPWLVPFGFDQGNGPLFVDMKDRPGRIVYTPWDQTQDEPMPIYHVADSIDEFLKASPWPLEDEARCRSLGLSGEVGCSG